MCGWVWNRVYAAGALTWPIEESRRCLLAPQAHPTHPHSFNKLQTRPRQPSRYSFGTHLQPHRPERAAPEPRAAANPGEWGTTAQATAARKDGSLGAAAVAAANTASAYQGAKLR